MTTLAEDLDDAKAAFARLCVHVERLQQENRRLRGDMSDEERIHRLTVLRDTLGLKRTGARIVLALWIRRAMIATPVLAEMVLPHNDRRGDELVLMRNHVNRVRKAIGHDAIEAERGLGYRLSDAMRAKVTDLLKDH